MDLSLFFAGTARSVPTARRGLPVLLLRAGGDRVLFDCGEGTQQQLLRSVGLPELDAVFITHYHLDHWLGLVGMLKTFDVRELEPHEEVRFDGYLIGAFPVEHRAAAFGYAFVEEDRPGRFDAAAARAL